MVAVAEKEEGRMFSEPFILSSNHLEKVGQIIGAEPVDNNRHTLRHREKGSLLEFYFPEERRLKFSFQSRLIVTIQEEGSLFSCVGTTTLYDLAAVLDKNTKILYLVSPETDQGTISFICLSRHDTFPLMDRFSSRVFPLVAEAAKLARRTRDQMMRSDALNIAADTVVKEPEEKRKDVSKESDFSYTDKKYRS